MRRTRTVPKKTRIIKDVLWFFAFCGLVAGILRMGFGLGSTTNLSDEVPWGLWKIFNMIAGVALSTSGFTVGFLVVVLRIERFRPLLKPAILVAFLGYGASCLALLFDIGLPHRFWHPILMWNEHSFLFEVFWCVLLYFTVTSIELIPNILERFRAEKWVRMLHRISFGVVVVGISLSSLHHSSLGSLFLVTPQRLHPLWYSEMIPFFFILSAMGAGLMVIVLLRILYARWYNPEPVFGAGSGEVACAVNINGSTNGSGPGNKNGAKKNGASKNGYANGNGFKRLPGKELPMLKGVASIAAAILGVYFLLRVVDLIATGKFGLLFSGSWESWLLLFELLVSVVLPVTFMLIPKVRNSVFGIGSAAFFAASGLALNRLDVGIFGYFRDAGTIYFPSLAEWAVGLGTVAAGGLAFFFVVENFTIFDDSWKRRSLSQGIVQASRDTLSRVWNMVFVSSLHRVSLIAVFTLPIAWVMMYPPFLEGGTSRMPVKPSAGIDTMREVLRIDGNRSGLYTDFDHKAHQGMMGDERSCAQCHHLSMPDDRSTPCFQCHRDMVEPTKIFDHFSHMRLVAEKEELEGWIPSNRSCSLCHAEEGPRSAFNARACTECHAEDMGATESGTIRIDSVFMWASGYQEAMHGACIDCHKKKGEALGRPQLGECITCHPCLLKQGRLKSTD